jgi:hypothetical protein
VVQRPNRGGSSKLDDPKSIGGIARRQRCNSFTKPLPEKGGGRGEPGGRGVTEEQGGGQRGGGGQGEERGGGGRGRGKQKRLNEIRREILLRGVELKGHKIRPHPVWIRDKLLMHPRLLKSFKDFLFSFGKRG